MNTEYLKEFVVLAETKNFWEASDRLYMNQSCCKNGNALVIFAFVNILHTTITNPIAGRYNTEDIIAFENF